jgi:hypothetical protein
MEKSRELHDSAHVVLIPSMFDVAAGPAGQHAKRSAEEAQRRVEKAEVLRGSKVIDAP